MKGGELANSGSTYAAISFNFIPSYLFNDNWLSNFIFYNIALNNLSPPFTS